LNRARETANRVKCASNQRQIAMACLLYCNEHKGQMPPDLGTLILTEEITVDSFICPSGNTVVPPEVMAGKPEGIAKWVSENADYVYLGKGKTSDMGAEQVLAYEKDEHHGTDGMNIVFGDGSVQFIPMAHARELIAKQGVK
jgi:prepilin-type processing-associated H-X9-DG protein